MLVACAGVCVSLSYVSVCCVCVWGGAHAHTHTQGALLLRCTANNSRITVGNHNWDLKQEGRTDGGKHYTYAPHTHAKYSCIDTYINTHAHTY